NSNPAIDLLVCLERHREIGFRYIDVVKAVVITHGADDRRVPVENVRWIAAQMGRRRIVNGMGLHGEGMGGEELGGCEVRVLEGQGHGLMANALVMADVLGEIARSAFEDVRRVRLYGD
ncbi:hypothetical protein LTR66_007685, partial [Elasticomyces elasticus]